MPSPIGHVLGALTAGWAVAGPASSVRQPARPAANIRRALVFGAVGLAPDADLLVGLHSAYTHSIGAAALVFVAALAVVGRRRWPLALGVATAYFSHPVLDWLGEDTSTPLGVMLWWPASQAYYHSGLDWFQAISRRYWLPGFWSLNLRSVAREVILLVPAAVAVVVFRRGSGFRFRHHRP